MKADGTDLQRRLLALAQYQIMDTGPEPAFDDLTARAARIFGAPIAAMTLLDERRQWFKARIGLEESETPIEDAFCATAIQDPEQVLVVPDARLDRRFRMNPQVTKGTGICFYAGAPLVTPEGVAIGTICVKDRQPREVSKTEREILRGLAREAVALLEAARWRKALQNEHAQYRNLEQSEAYFRHLTEFSLDLITILEENGMIRFESRSIERHLGHSPAHYRGRNAFEFVHPEDLPAVMSAFRQALQCHGNTPVIRFRFRHADGSYRMLEGIGNNLLADPVVNGIVFNSRDVTETVRLQEEVERARSEKEDTLARLTGGVAHDFNNILTAVQGLAELTEKRVPPRSPEAVYIAEIQSGISRAAELTRQLLAFSRRLVLQPRALELLSWLRELDPRLSSTLGPGIELTIVGSPDLLVWEDPVQFEQVIFQLAANARESMPYGGRFTLEALPVVLGPNDRPADNRSGEVSYVKLSVTDQGYGMDKCTMARIFEPFFTTKTYGHHPGLGLCMCRGVVEQSGGHLTVHSHPGRGTVFHLFLPAAEAIEQEPPPPLAVPIYEDAPTILFVDDEPLLRDIGETILREEGYRVIVAEDGFEALAHLAELGPTPLALLVSDVIMPGMTGVQLAEEVLRQRAGTRVMLCSGYTRDSLIQGRGMPQGAIFLQKPYPLATLLEKVRALLSTQAV